MPPKAFLEGGELAHEFYVARELGMTVQRLRDEMSNLEFMQWTRFLGVEHQSRQLAERSAAAGMGGR
jgi:hypothetical protein